MILDRADVAWVEEIHATLVAKRLDPSTPAYDEKIMATAFILRANGVRVAPLVVR